MVRPAAGHGAVVVAVVGTREYAGSGLGVARDMARTVREAVGGEVGDGAYGDIHGVSLINVSADLKGGFRAYWGEVVGRCEVYGSFYMSPARDLSSSLAMCSFKKVPEAEERCV